jgi:hypothetical protein
MWSEVHAHDSAKRASRRRWVVVNPCATRGVDGAQRGPARYDVRDRSSLRQMWGVALKGNAPQATQICVCVLAMPFRRHRKGRERVGPVQPGSRPAAVGRAGPFRPDSGKNIRSSSSRLGVRVTRPVHYGRTIQVRQAGAMEFERSCRDCRLSCSDSARSAY